MSAAAENSRKFVGAFIGHPNIRSFVVKKGLIIATVIVVVVLIFVGLLALKTFSIIGNFKSQMKKHTQMSTEELSALNDEELFSAISDRVDDEIYYSDDVESALANANKQKQIFYTV